MIKTVPCTIIPNGGRWEQSSVKISIPTQCPNCEIALDRDPLSLWGSDKMLPAIYFCPNCNMFFHADYVNNPQNNLLNIFPSNSKKVKFSSELSSLSPDFVEIYNQARMAESENLYEICGIGYRKALEFLIKDYAISKNPEKENKIKSTNLSECIANYICDDRIKSLSKAATWLGNDEAHYIKKHLNYDLTDLKNFINAAVAFIQYDLEYQKALAFLGDPE